MLDEQATTEPEPTASPEIAEQLNADHDLNLEDESEETPSESAPLTEGEGEEEQPAASPAPEEAGAAAEEEAAPQVTVESLQENIASLQEQLGQSQQVVQSRTGAYDKLMGEMRQLQAQHKQLMDAEVARIGEVEKDNDQFALSMTSPETAPRMIQHYVQPMIDAKVNDVIGRFATYIDNQEWDGAWQRITEFAEQAGISGKELHGLIFDDQGVTKYGRAQYRSALESEIAVKNAIRATYAERLIKKTKAETEQSVRRNIEKKKAQQAPRGGAPGGAQAKATAKDRFLGFMNDPEGQSMLEDIE